MPQKNNGPKKGKIFELHLPLKLKRLFWGIFSLLLAFILFLSYFEKAGIFGKVIFSIFSFLFGKATFFFFFLFLLSGFVFLFSKYEKFEFALLLALFFFSISLATLFKLNGKDGGIFGVIFAKFTKLFGKIFTQILFFSLLLFSLIIFWHLLKPLEEKKEKKTSISFVKRIFFGPTFKVSPIEKTQQLPKVIPEIEKPKEKEKIPFRITTTPKGFQLPPLELLEKEFGEINPGDIQENTLIIKRTLEHFNIPVQMGSVNIGPTVTQYTLKPAEGIKLSKITALSNDLALALAAHPIRIEAPIPGKSLVGIEVPNKKRLLVRLRPLIEDQNFQRASSPLTIVLGRDVSGTPVFADLIKMPHLLVAGATGTGKSIFLNTIIISLLYRNSPETLRFILIDPKRVEFPVYNDLPHLLTPVIFEPKKAVLVLNWLIREMERRFEILSETKARNILSYNAYFEKKDREKILPFILLIIDELADLMAAKGKEIEAGIVRIAQMARAVGIHLIVATQRPSVEVLTGLIKANITTRVSFQVASQFDSRTILDIAGAEKLLGAGDFLFMSAENPKPKRIQAPFISEKEIKRIVEFLATKNAKWKFEKIDLNEFLASNFKESLFEEETGFLEEDPLYEEAKRIVIEAKKASASLLQRRLSIGYARAARLLDMLEERGIIGPPEGAKPRKVLVLPREEEEEWKKV